jgi:hypothetical protein
MYKICRRCQFHVEIKAKLCRICGFRYFYEYQAVDQKAAEKAASPAPTNGTPTEFAQSILKRIATTASSFLA